MRPNQRNRYRALWEFSRGTVDVASTPLNLQMARSNHCNFKCLYCIDHRPGNTVPRSSLNGETWDRLLELIPRTEQLAFHGISEFMVDPQFVPIVERCAQAGAHLSINTNGSVCTPKHVKLFASYPGHLVINFSLDAATAETFFRIRGWHFDRVLNNIRTFMKGFEERKNLTWVTLSFVINKSNVREMHAFVFLAKALNVDGVKFYRMHEYDGLEWSVTDPAGKPFDYQEECAVNFVDDFNREIVRAKKAAEMLDIRAEIPAPIVVAEMAAEATTVPTATAEYSPTAA